MTREEAVAAARTFWGRGRPKWEPREDRAQHREGTPYIYGLADTPHWWIPLEWTAPHVGGAHALVVDERTRAVREVSWGE